MLNYGVGDKVVCVDDKFPPDIGKLYDALPVKDTTYVVRDIRLGINLTRAGDVSVLLVASSTPRRNPGRDSNAAFARIASGRSRNGTGNRPPPMPLKKRRNKPSPSKPREMDLLAECISPTTPLVWTG